MPKVIIVGANRGIGLSLTEKYGQEGWQVLALCRKKSPALSATAAKILEGVDVCDKAALEKVTSDEPLASFDLIIHNAGILKHTSFERLDYSALEEQFQVNTLGAIKATTLLLPLLKKGGKIALISSRAGSIGGLKTTGYYGYRLSKAALNMYGALLARELRGRATVLILHPGHVQTEMTEGRGDYSADEAACNLFQQIERSQEEESGEFYHANGDKIPW